MILISNQFLEKLKVIYDFKIKMSLSILILI